MNKLERHNTEHYITRISLKIDLTNMERHSMPPTPTQFTVTGVTARLFEILLEMPKEKQKELIVLVGDQREHTRLPFLMAVTYETNDDRHRDFILDISPGGTFIETEQALFIGQMLTLTFQFRHEPAPFKVIGSVVWQSTNGVGIAFSFNDIDHKQQLARIVKSLTDDQQAQTG